MISFIKFFLPLTPYRCKGRSHIRSVRKEKCLLERALVLGHRQYEIGWLVPILAAFISPLSPPGPHLLLGVQRASNQWFQVGSEPRSSAQ